MYSWKHLKGNDYYLFAEKKLTGRRIVKKRIVTVEDPAPENLTNLARDFENDVFPYACVDTYKDHRILKYFTEVGYRVEFGTKRSREVESIEAAKALVDLTLTE